MALPRSLPIVMLWLCLQSSLYLQGSNCHGSTSLWGKKAEFPARTCMWQLGREVAVPALDELSVCVLLRLGLRTEWTAFAYKAPGNPAVELGLEGDTSHVTPVLFGGKWPLNKTLSSNHWHSVCLTWAAPSQKLRLYVNGTRHLDVSATPSSPVAAAGAAGRRRLAPGGTLTLGVPHYVDESGAVQREDGRSLMGDVGLFRMWAREWRGEELRYLGCVEGDVVSWDTRHWNYAVPWSCPPKEDPALRCEWSSYEIKMWAYVTHSNTSDTINSSLESITSHWMESIFTQNISVQNVSVTPPSRPCLAGNNPAALYIQQPQKSKGLGNLTFDDCFFSKVRVSVSPKSSVESVQAYITERLGAKFSYHSLTLMTDLHRLIIQPVEPFHTMTKPPPLHPESPAPETTRSFPAVSTGAPTAATNSTPRFPSSPTNTTTTEVPFEINNTVVKPDLFFRVNLTLAFNGNPTNPTSVMENWVKECLVLNNMNMLNFRIIGDHIRNTEHSGGQTISHRQNKEYECTFHVQGHLSWNSTELKILISQSLSKEYINETISIQTRHVVIQHIVPKNCPAENQQTVYGLYTWDEMFPQEGQEITCVKPPSGRAFRFCKLDINSDTTSWEDPNMTACMPLMIISDLDEVNVTAANAANIMLMIQDLVGMKLGMASGGDGELSTSDMLTVVGKLDDVINVSVVTAKLCDDIVGMISDILISKSDMSSVANMVMNLTERLGDSAVFSEDSYNVSTPALAISMNNVYPKTFRGITFSVSSFTAGAIPQIAVNQSFGEATPDSVATIALPPALRNQLAADRNKTRIQFQFYGIRDLFNDTDITIGAEGNWTLNSYVISASINNSTVSNLQHQRVAVTLGNNRAKQEHETVMCVFWDFHENDGRGGWSGRGCETQVISAHRTSCSCNHLTSFAVLLDITRAPVSDKDSEIMTVISYLGCGISSIFLGITLVTYLAFGKLRRDYPSKILINLSAALLGLNLVYLLNAWLTSFSSYGLCILTAVVMHYFLLAAFVWMGLEALHMYFALVKVFNVYVVSYILKFCIVGWGVPLIIVGLVLATDVDAYGNNLPGGDGQQPFCWIQSNVHFYVTVAAFIMLVLLCNAGVFAVVLIQIRRMRANNPSGKLDSGGAVQELRAAASLTVLLGLTWLIAFFSFGPGKVVLLYMFCVLNSLQGFFIFLFHCLMKDNVRKQWRMHLSLDRFKHNEFSDWSRSATASGRHKQKQDARPHSMGSTGTSSIIKVSESSSSSAESGPDRHQRE